MFVCKGSSRSVVLLLTIIAMLAPSRCETGESLLSNKTAAGRENLREGKSFAPLETRKQFHSRFSSSASRRVVTDVVSREAYMKSIPLRVLDCLEHVSLLDCGKLYLLQNMEARSYRFANTGNLTHDLQQLILPGYRAGDNKLFSDTLLALNGTDVNQRLGRGLRLMLHQRIVDLTLDVAVADGEVGRDKAKKGLKTVLQFSVPLILLPSMLLAGVLPMILPVLKFATIFSSIVNHAALAAAIMYLAKQHAAEQESKQTVYFNAGYN
ncbi:AGAP013445-PA-like protein [Anopheles sinensis]|uniref:AGAP013445-PA-like protein n=1 Tax=Anopheles sinensis TaxID=74873 RepID=A0A084VZD7_ANOSI|nr:AGAP013445-PA-like protein [Anopheles sinensis]